MNDQSDPLFLAIEGTRPSLPTDAERERSIAAVLDAALPQRARRGWLGWPLREFPPSLLFFGVEDCLFLAMLFAGLCLAPAALACVQTTLLPALLFLVSPALYLGVAPPDHVEGIHERHAGMEANLPRAVAEGHGAADVRVRRRIGGGVRGDVCRAVAAFQSGVAVRLDAGRCPSPACSSMRRFPGSPACAPPLGALCRTDCLGGSWRRAAALGGCGDVPAAGSHLRVLAGGVLCPAALLGRGQALGNIPSVEGGFHAVR